METTIVKIKSFEKLQPGWSFGEGSQFEKDILTKGIKLIKIAGSFGFKETDAFPGLNGEVMVTLYLEENYWEFTIQPDRNVTFVQEKNDETIIYEEGLSFKTAISKLKEIGILVLKEKWNLSELLMQDITIQESEDLQVWSSKIQLVGGYRFSARNVPEIKETVYANISENFIQPSAANHRFSGNLKKARYQMATN